MPPTFIIGIKVIAITIIPMPPSHWRSALQSRIPFGESFKFIIIVEPVVVMPDILSNKESVIDSCRFEKTNGNDPNIAILNQERDVNKKACCKFNFLSWSKFAKKNSIPNIIVIIPAPINDESNSPYIIWITIGMIIEIPRIIWRTPKVKKTVL